MAQPVTLEPTTSGRATVKTTAGDIVLEFWPREAPKAVRNFVQLALEGYYEGCQWHRIVPGLCVQTGDASNSGEGGDSIYEEGMFQDEFSQRLRFNRRGLVAMANAGKRNTNLSQFFITLDRADSLQNKHTIFATVRGDTYFNVLGISESELQPGTDRPVYPTTIKSIEIDDNPFPDIEPRITAEEKRTQEKARREARKNAANRGKKKEGTKNKSLISFEDEEEEGTAPNVKIGSAHDALNDPTLRKEIKSRRELPGVMPEGFGQLPSADVQKPSGSKRKADQMEHGAKAQRGSVLPNAFDSATYATKIEEDKPREAETKKRKEPEASGSMTESERVKAEIAKVQADLKKLTRKGGSDDEADPASNGKAKQKAKESGAALLAAERAKYTQGGRSIGKDKATSGKGKKRKEEDEDVMSMLEGFRGKIRAAAAEAGSDSAEPADQNGEPASVDGYAGEILELDGDDEGWMGHLLKFRKDATMDQHTIDEYEVIDTRGMTLEDAKRHEARLKRKSGAPGGSGRLGGAATAAAEKDLGRRDRGGGSNRGRERY